MPAQLTPLLGAWLSTQMAGFGTWVDRQLQSEDWRPLGAEQPHSSSARELRRIALESLEALFGLGLPLPPAVVRQHMDGIAGMMTRCASQPRAHRHAHTGRHQNSWCDCPDAPASEALAGLTRCCCCCAC